MYCRHEDVLVRPYDDIATTYRVAYCAYCGSEGPVVVDEEGARKGFDAYWGRKRGN